MVFHFEWCSKYRYNMLRQSRYKDFLAEVLQKETAQMKVRILEMGIQSDHVHLVVVLRPTHAVSSVFQHLKGKSAYELFRFEPKFRLRYPNGEFWSPGKFYRSVGDVDLETTRNYVKAQDHRQQSLVQAG